MNNNLKTPILFVIFNRLDTAKRVFEEIKKAKPLKLYIFSDGPREDVLGEYEKVKEVRNFIESNIDWGCEVKTLFRDKNLGCKFAVIEAINWFFKNEERGIIIEHDCLPDQSFFRFCEELLIKYENDERIVAISGNNFNNKKIGKDDYYFKKIPHIWGWATWKRVWREYDADMRDYPDFKKNNKIKNVWRKKKSQRYWLNMFEDTYNNKISTWDYQLSFMAFNKGLLSICPNVNLVSNIGFGVEAVNTIMSLKGVSDLKNSSLNFPLKHPNNVIYKESSDLFINKKISKLFYFKYLLKKLRVFNILKSLLINFRKSLID